MSFSATFRIANFVGSLLLVSESDLLKAERAIEVGKDNGHREWAPRSGVSEFLAQLL